MCGSVCSFAISINVDSVPAVFLWGAGRLGGGVLLAVRQAVPAVSHDISPNNTLTEMIQARVVITRSRIHRGLSLISQFVAVKIYVSSVADSNS